MANTIANKRYVEQLEADMKKLKQEDLEGYAKGLKLNMKKFKKDMADASLEEQVKRDQALAAKIGARGTPTSFVNGYMVRGAQPVAAFKKIIDRELAKAKAPKAKKK